MTAKLPWYKRNPSDWQRGTRKHAMSFELRGFYSECLDAMWELQAQLPKDAKVLAMMLGTNPRLVRSLMVKLIDLGKMIETESGYYNPRMMADILEVETVDQSGDFEPVSTLVQPRIKLEPTSNQARTNLEPSAKIQKNPMISRATLEEEEEIEREESPKPPLGASTNVKPIANWNTAFSSSDCEPHVTVKRHADGRLELLGEARERWLAKFGGNDERLDLALVEIAGQVNEGSRKPISADVESRLARMVGLRIDQTERYVAAAVVKTAEKPKVRVGRFGQKILVAS